MPRYSLLCSLPGQNTHFFTFTEDQSTVCRVVRGKAPRKSSREKEMLRRRPRKAVESRGKQQSQPQVAFSTFATVAVEWLRKSDVAKGIADGSVAPSKLLSVDLSPPSFPLYLCVCASVSVCGLRN